MKYIYFLIAVFCSLYMTSQEFLIKNIELEWMPKQTFQIDKNKTWQIPIVKNNSINVATKMPDFVKKWQVPNYSKVSEFEIKNIVYKDVPKQELYDVALVNIPSTIQPSFEITSTRDISHAYIRITPLIKQDNRIQKVLSFEVHYQLKTLASNYKNTYASNSVLASGDWFKFSVDTTGVFKIDYSFLKNIGVNINSINPSHLSIYGNGGHVLPYRIGDFRYDDLQENAIYVNGEEDGSFDSNDYILFYARGPESWKHDGTIESLEHVKNIYSDKAYYFIHIKNQVAKRITDLESNNSPPQLFLTNYDDYIVHEIDRKNLFQMGQQWLGESFDITSQKTISIRFDNIDTAYPVSITTRAVASSVHPTSMDVSIGSQSIYSLGFGASSQYIWARERKESENYDASSDQFDVKLSYTNNGDAAAKAYLDYIEIIGKKKLNATDKQFSFRNFEMINNNIPISFKLQNASKIYNLWDVTDPITPKRISNQSSGNEFTFTVQGGRLNEYVVLSTENYYTPNSIDNPKINNQNLHALQDVDYLIITKEFLINEAESLAQYHRENSGLNVEVVPLYQIYNEFGSGANDITAIRDFIKFLYDNSTPRLQYVLMFGDASYDFKEIYEKEENIVPSFQSYISYSVTNAFVTDDFFAIVSDDDEGDLDFGSIQTQDVAISRMPVRTITEAKNVIDKMLSYYKESALGDWRNQIAIIADDADKISDITLQVSQEILADKIKINKPIFNIKKIYADAYPQVISSGGAEYPEANKAIVNSIEKGVLVANYFGHGGEDGLAAEKLLTTQNIEAWNNYNTLPLIMIISCEFARFDNPSRPNTAGELVIRNPNGGGVHHIATARAIYINVGGDLNNGLIPRLLEYNPDLSNSISENLRISKNNDTGSKQRYFVFSFGDAAMKLAVPKPDIQITHMNNKPITQELDTIKALSHVSFKGIITDNTGNLDSSFNGVLSATIYDKPIDKETLNNDGVAGIMVFDTQESKIFRGSATVSNGAFSFDFVVPKDIRIAYGKGKLSFYADNDSSDKAGYNLDVTVGGIDENAPEDNQGPIIQLYMNDKSFIDGGSTNQSPLFLAFFEDENGINTSLSSVDHDIVAILDDDQQNPILLNDYYTTELNNYKKGNLEYRLRNLEIGTHKIHLKAYDTYNNPAEAVLQFVVLDDSELVIEHVLNYPNPFVNYTEFWFSHNKPNEPLEVQVQIYTVSGKLVKTINRLIQSPGSHSREIQWDGLDDFGKKIGKGVYVYKLSINATQSELKAEKYEKLVILQ